MVSVPFGAHPAKWLEPIVNRPYNQVLKVKEILSLPTSFFIRIHRD